MTFAILDTTAPETTKDIFARKEPTAVLVSRLARPATQAHPTGAQDRQLLKRA